MLGVAVSTIYRWEAATGTPRMDPLQREILLELQARKISKTEGADLAQKIRKGLISGGTLRALYVLLTFLTKETTDGE